MGKCDNIGVLRSALSNDCDEIKPNGQIKHTVNKVVINTYDTGSVVIQDNTKDKEVQKNVNALVTAINNLNNIKCAEAKE